MKIEQDLRIAIKAAADQSKRNSNSWEKSKNREEAIAKFLKSFPQKAMRLKKLQTDYANGKKLQELCEQKAQKELGLSLYDYRGRIEIHSEAAFTKAGGKIPKTDEFTAEQVITEYAGAKTKTEAATVLKKFGIVWE